VFNHFCAVPIKIRRSTAARGNSISFLIYNAAHALAQINLIYGWGPPSSERWMHFEFVCMCAPRSEWESAQADCAHEFPVHGKLIGAAPAARSLLFSYQIKRFEYIFFCSHTCKACQNYCALDYRTAVWSQTLLIPNSEIIICVMAEK
jgi:hypothetical protein